MVMKHIISPGGADPLTNRFNLTLTNTKKLKTVDLIKAILLLELRIQKKIIAIEYEDGSGCKFNFKLEGSNKWSYVDLTDDLIP
jgi:hypothetical protein